MRPDSGSDLILPAARLLVVSVSMALCFALCQLVYQLR
jgi:hypothetical protein